MAVFSGAAQVAFTHNPKSQKSKAIMEAPINGLCKRCTEQIEWKKQYRKYKPLKAPVTCRDCKQKTVMSAYHNLCTACADRLGVCAKCTQNEEVVNRPEVDRSAEIEAKLKTFKERTRRTLVRKIEKGELEAVAVLDMVGDKKKKDAEDDSDDDDDEDDDSNEEEAGVDDGDNDDNEEANEVAAGAHNNNE